MKPARGLRVVRGPDWEWGDQDGGEGFVGTVAGLEEGGGGVIVQWDMGLRNCYRCGRDNKFDLRVLDCAQIGIKHQSVECASCKEMVCGFLWKCVHCFEVGGLCSKCYMAGWHSTFHSFMRIDTENGVRVKVRPRRISHWASVHGMFPEAVVMRGVDWKWDDQDGGSGNLGDVTDIHNWKNESFKSIVQVLWRETKCKNKYRLGHVGKVDLKCYTAAPDGMYCPSHLPVLGGEQPGEVEGELAAGDKVRVELDQESWKELQKDHGDWEDLMAEFIGTTGVVQHVTDSGVLIISYPGQAVFPVNPRAVTKVEGVPVYAVGDIVKVNEGEDQVNKEQKGHGGWREEMAESLSQTGKVVKVLPSGDVQVAVGDRRWVFSPSCLQPGSSQDLQEPQSEDGQVSELVSSQLESLVKLNSPDLVVAASAAGDLPTLRDYLTRNPDQVDAKVKGKTGLMVATAEGWPEVVRVLLESGAKVDESDEDGDTALHYCAYLDREEIARQLLDKNADPNICNSLGASPLLYAVALGNYGVMRLLVNSDRLDHSLQEKDGNTVLHVAVAAYRSEAVRILLEAGATPTVPNHSHLTPILAAATTGFYLGLEQFIRSHGKEVISQTDKQGNTALHLAAANNHLDLVCLLAEKRACDIDATNGEKGQTALHIAASEGHTRIVEHLLVCKANPDIIDTNGCTVLQLVIANKNNIKTPSEFSPKTLKISRDLHNSRGFPENYVAIGCLLAEHGAKFDRDSLTRNSGCSTYFVNLIVSYAGKSSRT